MSEWRIIEDEAWEMLEDIAAERETRRRDDRNYKQLTKNPHFCGLVGQEVYAQETGLIPDYTIRPNGDGGQDFQDGIDVKTCTYWKDPYLKENPSRAKWPVGFALVAVKLDERKGRVVGFATVKMVKAAERIDWGYGPKLSLHGDQLISLKDWINGKR